MADHKNQHFVPRCVLRPFTLNCEDKAINLYTIRTDRLVQNAPVKHQCAHDYLYGQDGVIEAGLAIAYADMEARRGKGCASIWISSRELRLLGPKTPEGISTDRLRGVTVLQAGDQACLTVFRNGKSKAYRHDVAKRQ